MGAPIQRQKADLHADAPESPKYSPVLLFWFWETRHFSRRLRGPRALPCPMTSLSTGFSKCRSSALGATPRMRTWVSRHPCEGTQASIQKRVVCTLAVPRPRSCYVLRVSLWPVSFIALSTLVVVPGTISPTTLQRPVRAVPPRTIRASRLSQCDEIGL